MNFNNNNKHEIKTKFRFIDNEIQGNTKGLKGVLLGPGHARTFQGGFGLANSYGLRVC